MILVRRFFLILLATLLWRYNDDPTFLGILDWILKIAPWFLLVWLGYQHFSDKLEWRFLKSPFKKEHSPRWARLLNIWICLLLICIALQIGTIKIQNTAPFYATTLWWQRGYAISLALLALAPPKKVCLSCNLLLLALSSVLTYHIYLVNRIPSPGEAVVIKSPIHSPFAVLSGGYSSLNSVLQSKHTQSRRFGVHMRPSEGEFLNAAENSDPFPAPFGEPIYAPASGTIIAAQDTQDDLPMGSPLPDTGPGNFLMLEIAPERFLLFAHLQKESIQPKVGDRVEVGEPLARLGKSGMVTEPLLLLLVFNKSELFDPDIESFPILFEDVNPIHHSQLRDDGLYFPTRNDFFLPNPPIQ